LRHEQKRPPCNVAVRNPSTFYVKMRGKINESNRRCSTLD
jgi:hypothetical protein